jgi:hypothetical protein
MWSGALQASMLQIMRMGVDATSVTTGPPVRAVRVAHGACWVTDLEEE